MIWQPDCNPLPGLSRQTTGKIFHISRRCVIAVLISLETFGPTTALGAHRATRASATVTVLSPPPQPGRPTGSSPQTDPPDMRLDPSAEHRVVDRLYEKLMWESARVLNGHE
jgi:hypothetical protein